MRRFATIVCLFAALGQSAAMAQQKTPIDTASIPEAVKNLKWQDIDLASLPARERCRSLWLFNDVVSELGMQTAADADLMSEFIDDKDLGADFAAQPPIDVSKAITLADAQKVAVALLRGPMAQSTYTTDLADVPDNQLAAYEQLYQSGAQAKWSGFVHNRLQLMSMSSFLKTSGKMEEYRAWAPAEVKRRSDEFNAELAKKNAAAQTQREDRQQQAQARKQAEQEEQAQQKQQQQASAQMQQALSAAQQSQGSTNQSSNNDHDDDDYYYGGGAYLAANAYYRDAAYHGAAAARTTARMNNWRGGGGGGGGARRGGGGGRR